MKLRLPLALAVAVVAACSFVEISKTVNAKDIISINIGSAIDGDTLLGDAAVAVAGKYWTSSNNRNQTSLVLQNQIGTDIGAKTSWSSGTTYPAGSSNPILTRYMNGNISLNVIDLPFFSYDLYLYASDANASAGKRYNPVYVNGEWYTANGGETVKGTSVDTWGENSASRVELIQGTNELHMTGLSGNLLLKMPNGNNALSSISALQIVDTYTGTVQDMSLSTGGTWASLVNLSSDAQRIAVTTAGGAVLRINGVAETDGIILQSGKLWLSGGSMKFTGPASLTVLSGAILYLDTDFVDHHPFLGGSGAIVMGRDYTFDMMSGGATMDLNGHKLVVNTADGTMSDLNTLIGYGSAEKDGTGILSASGNMSFTGGLLVKAGTLSVGGVTTLGSRALTMNGGSVLDFLADASLSNNLVFSGGTGSVNVASGAATLSGKLNGEYGFTKTGGGELKIEHVSHGGFSGDIVVDAGTLTLGRQKNEDSVISLGSGTIVVGNGATLNMQANVTWITNLYYFDTNIHLKNGSTFDILKGGDPVFTGLVTIGENAGDKAVLQTAGNYTFRFAGGLTGAGDVDVKSTEERTARIQLYNDNSSYTGTISLFEANMILTDARTNASVNMIGSGTNEYQITLNQGKSSIKSISSTNTYVKIAGAAGTGLTINEGGSFAGKLDGAFMLKAGGNLTLNGDSSSSFTGSLEFSGSSLTLGNDGALGTGSLRLTGNTAIKGNSAAYKKVSVLGGTAIDASGMTGGGLVLGTGQNLTIQSNSAGTALNWTGNLTFGGGTLAFVAGSGGNLSGIKMNGGTVAKTASTAVAVTLGDAYWDNGSHVLIDFGAGAPLSSGDFVATGFDGNLMRSQRYEGLKVENGKLMAVLSGGVRGNLTWNAASGTWSLTADPTPWTGSPDSKFYAGDNVTFGNVTGQAKAEVTISGTVMPGAFIVSAGTETEYTFKGDGVIAGETRLVKNGTGVMIWDNTGVHTYYGGTDIQKGVLYWKEGTFGTGAINIEKGATLRLWAENATASASKNRFTANLTGTGNVEVWGVGNLSDSGGSNGDNTVLNLGADFTGSVEIRKGVVSISESVFGGGAGIILNGGGLVSNNVKDFFSNDIVVKGTGSVIRLYGGKTTTYTGSLGGDGELKHTDGGTLIFTGDLSAYAGDFRNSRGTVSFNSAGLTQMKSLLTNDTGSVVNMNSSYHILGNITDTGAGVRGTLNFNNTGIIDGRFSVRDATVNVSADMTVKELWLCHGKNGDNAACTFNLTSGNLVISGNNNSSGDNCSIQLGYYDNASNAEGLGGKLNISGGTFTADNANIFMSWDGTGILNITGGTASVRGIVFKVNSSYGDPKGYVNLSNGGRLNVGEGGIVLSDGSNDWNSNNKTDSRKDNLCVQSLKLGDGILGATADWTSTAPIELTNAEKGLVINTEHAKDPSLAGHTVTLGGNLSGIGKLVKDGDGVLKLTGTGLFEGGLELRKGTLYLEKIESAGLAGKRELKINGGSAAAPLTLSSAAASLAFDKITTNAGSILNLGGASALTLSASSVVLGDGTTLIYDNLPNDSGDRLSSTGTMTLGGSLTFQWDATQSKAGDVYTLLSAGSFAGITEAELKSRIYINSPLFDSQADYRPFHYQLAFTGDAVKSLTMTILSGGPETVTWTGAGGSVWDLHTTSSWKLAAGTATVFYLADRVVLGDVSGSDSQTITVSQGLNAANMTVNANSTAYTLTGSLLTLDGDLTLSGSRTLTLQDMEMTVKGSVSNTTGTLALNDSSLTLTKTDAAVNVGILSGVAGASSINFGAGTLVVGLENASDANHLSLIGSGKLKAGGTNALNVGTQMTGTVYGGTGGLNITGASVVTGVYGGSWDSQTVASGRIVVGSLDSSVSTVLDFGTAQSQEKGIYGAGAHLGTAMTSGVNGTVLTNISLVGQLTGAVTESTVSSNTVVTGRIAGGGKAGADVYGSTHLSLSGVRFVGSNDEPLGFGSASLVGGGFPDTTVYGNVVLDIRNSLIDSLIYGAGGNVTGDVNLTIDGSRVTGRVFAGTYGGGGVTFGNLNVVITNSILQNGVYGLRDGIANGAMNISLTNSTVSGNVVAGGTVGNTTHLKKGAHIVLDGVTAGMVGLAGANNEIVEGDSSITIKGDSTITNFQGIGGAVSSTFTNNLEYGRLNGNFTVTIEGGTIGAGMQGTESNMFSVSGRDGLLTGNTLVDIKGGTISNEYLTFAGVGAQLNGDVTLKLSGTGRIESNIRATSTWGSRINGDLNFILDGGELGKEGEVRSLTSGCSWASYGNGQVTGNVKITLDGTLSNGAGTVIKGNYSILAGAPNGNAVGKDTSVTLSNISRTGGIADFSGVISGANESGTGVTGSVRSLTFDHYTTSTAAQYKYFTLATVKGASAVVMSSGVAASNIGTWAIEDTSSLEVGDLAQLGGASSVAIGGEAYLVINNTTEQNMSSAGLLRGNGTLLKKGSAELLLTSDQDGFTGTIEVTSSSFVLSGNGALDGNAEIYLNGGTLTTRKSLDFDLSSILRGTGDFIVNNDKGVKTTLSNSGTVSSNYTGKLRVAQGELVIGAGVALAQNQAVIEKDGKLTLKGALSSTIGKVTGTGILNLDTDFTLRSGNQVSDFLGTVTIGSNRNLTVVLNNGPQLLNTAASVGFSGKSVLTLENNIADALVYTVGGLDLAGMDNRVYFGGANSTHLTITSDKWFNSNGQVTFDLTDSVNSKIYSGPAVVGGSSVYSNVFLMIGGVTYQTRTDDNGQLVQITLEQMTELPVVGVPSLGSTTYKITGNNDDIRDGVLRMAGDAVISSLNIQGSDGTLESSGEIMPLNKEWNLNGHVVNIVGGSLMYQGNTDYLITGGTLKTESGVLGIAQTTDKLVTLESTIGEMDGSTTTLKKMGAGKLVLSGSLENKGGIQVVSGTLQLVGQATGNASAGTLSNSAVLELGDGVNGYVLGYAATVNTETGTLTVDDHAVLAGNITNAGSLTLKEGARFADNAVLTNSKDAYLNIGDGKTMSLTAEQLKGNGTLYVRSGTFETGNGTMQNFDVSAGTRLVWNMTGASSTGRILSGTGRILVNNASGNNLDLQGVQLGTRWTGFNGTLELGSNAGNMRVKFSSEMGASLVIVGNGTQYWDNSSVVSRNSNWELAGTGTDEFGALRISQSGTYTGSIKVAAGGSRISSENTPVTLAGSITGGTLELGTLNENYNSIFTLSGSNSHNLTKAVGKGRVIVTGKNALGGGLDLSSASASGEIKVNSETGYIQGAAGSTLTLTNASLTVTGSTSAVYAGSLYGTGDLVKKGTGTWTLSGKNTQNGSISVENGQLVAGSVNAFGAAGNEVKLGSNARLDLGGYAVQQGITMTGAGTLAGASNYNSRLVVAGNGSEVSQVVGDLKAGSLILQDAGSRLNVTGGVEILNGGSFSLDADNAYLDTALVTASGKVKLGGNFLLNLDTNDDYEGTNVKFKLFESTAYPEMTSNYTFALALDSAYEEFFKLKDNYKQEMSQTGKITVTIDVKACVGQLVDDGDVQGMGDAGYVSRGESFYLGAKENAGAPVYYDKAYSIASGDNAYRLTNGNGWLVFASQMTGDNKLVLNKHRQGTNPDSGVIIANNTNTYSGGTSALNVHLVIDGSQNQSAAMPGGGTIGALGIGSVTLLGRASILELRPNGEGTGSYTLGNAIDLRDGAQIWQSGGSAVTLTGDITAGGTEGGVIANRGASPLTLTGSLTANKLALKGGDIRLTGTYARNAGPVAEIGDLTLSDTTSLTVIDRSLSTGSLTMDKGSSLTAGSGSRINAGTLILGSAGTGTTVLTLDGGSLALSSDAQLGGADQIKLTLGRDATNTLDIAKNATVSLTGLQESDGSLAKTGEGALTLSGNLSAYKGSVDIRNGLVRLNTGNTQNNYTTGGDGAQLEIADNGSHSGTFTVNGGGTVITGSNVTLSGDLTLNGGALTTGKNTSLTGSHITLGDGSRATFGENTQLGNGTTTQITIGQNATVSFGTGSRLEGFVTGGLNFGQGSVYEGSLDAGANQVTFGSGSVFRVDGGAYDRYKDGKTVLTGTGSITLEQGMKFELTNFAENMTPLPADMGLIFTTGTLTLGGETVRESQNYNQYLGTNPYIWLAFDLIGGTNRLDLHIRKDVQFGRFADTRNEEAIAGLASDLALHNDQYKGQLGQLGTALSLATNANVNTLLGDLALSTSSVLSGYSVQIQNLRRHSFEIMNRAIQAKPDNQRLSYEDKPSTIWANGIGGTYKINGDSNALGNTANNWGGTLGVSTTISETTVMGMAFTYTDTDVKIDRGMGKATLDAYTIDLFARYHKDNWNLTGILSGGITGNDTERNLNLDGYNSRSKGSADGSQIMGMVQAGYEFTVSQDQNSILEPLVLISGGYNSQDGFRETGAGTAGLNVESASNSLCTLGAGVRFVREYLTDRETGTLEKGRFEVRALVLQDLTDLKPEIRASFQGASDRKFVQEGAAPGKTALMLGAGIVHPLSESTAVFADVDGEFRNGGTGVGANVGLKYMF